MTTRYVVPGHLVGRGISEDVLKRGLLELNRDFSFDVGGRKNLWHPDIEFSQGVFHGPPGSERHIATMDRKVCPEFSVWTETEDWVEVPWSEVKFGEPCFVKANDVPMVKRGVQDKCIQVGWRYTLGAVIAANIPGCDRQSVERKFGVSLEKEYSEFEIGIIESRAERAVDKDIVFQ